MEVKIGVQHAPRELMVDSGEDAASIESKVADAVTSGGLLTLEDTKGRRISVPGASIAYVEIGSTQVGTVGFRS